MKNDDTAYIVSTSFHRSGSSMLMRCLIAGGMKANIDNSYDLPWNMSAGNPEYMPNPNGFYTGFDEHVDWPSFYLESKGMLTKLFRASLPMLIPGKYKVIFMVRYPNEIIASMRSWTPNRSWGTLEVSVHFMDILKKALYNKLNARGDMEILEVDYNNVMKNPILEFERIRDFGFPIDVQGAVAMVDHKLYRNKLKK